VAVEEVESEEEEVEEGVVTEKDILLQPIGANDQMIAVSDVSELIGITWLLDFSLVLNAGLEKPRFLEGYYLASRRESNSQPVDHIHKSDALIITLQSIE